MVRHSVCFYVAEVSQAVTLYVKEFKSCYEVKGNDLLSLIIRMIGLALIIIVTIICTTITVRPCYGEHAILTINVTIDLRSKLRV